MLRDSDNGTAELLVKEVGRFALGVGTTAAGARVVHDALATAGAGFEGVTVADGSGLSDAARVTCRAPTTLLAGNADALTGRLPLAGSTGTLARRLVDTPGAGRTEAKAGSLEGTAALAGYSETASGTTAEFAFISNGLPPGASGRGLQDRLAAALATATT